MVKKFKKIGLLIFILGIQFIVISFFIHKTVEKKHIQKVENFIVSNFEKKEENFIAVLEIPKIKLKRGFYKFGSKNNHVDKNIEVIETSLMPDNKNSNLILASHSGNSKISFFKNLDKLKVNDIAYLYYNEKKYNYKLITMYNVLKNGTIEISKRRNETNLTLITCDRKNEKLQNVYVFKLISD